MQIRCLSFHAAYRCRHSGECCRAAWDIRVEPHVVEAVRSGRIVPLSSTPAPFLQTGRTPDFAVARTASGDCGFHNARRCSLQEAGTERMLPSACRHFPRIFLRDARGCLVTLSHFCPTAASMLFDETTVTVVDAAAPLALTEPIEGLDARNALPPLLRPGMLTDVEGYAAWEEAVVRTFVQSADAELALSRIAHATELIRRWRPAGQPLSRAVAHAFSSGPPHSSAPRELLTEFATVRELTGPHPLMAVAADFTDKWARIRQEAGAATHQAIGRYLAASAFGNWIAYRGKGLRSIVGWLRACHDVLRVQLVRHLDGTGRPDPAAVLESIRMADYLMVHTVDSLAFGRAVAALER